MRIWRDVPTRRGIARLSEGLHLPGNLRGRKARVAVDAMNITVERLLQRLDAYHAIKKDSYANLGTRLNRLRDLAASIELALQVQGPRGNNTLSGGAADIHQLLFGLARRARAKADYLALLIGYYGTNPDEVANPQALIDKLRAAQVKSDNGKQLGVVPGVRMEARDPIHRGWEMEFIGNDINPMGKTHQSFAAAWLRAVRAGTCNEPLLVYLEATEHCLDREMAKDAHTVKYLDVRGNSAPVYQLRVNAGAVEQAKMDSGTPNWEAFDTQWVTKSESTKGGLTHTLAYNWTTTKELFADLHNPIEGRDWDTFHHSSFTGGDIIRCAGMIGGVNGKIIYIDNDSGHYRPGTENLQRLVKHLLKRNAFAGDARVRDLSLRGFAAQEEVGIPADLYAQNPHSGPNRWVRANRWVTARPTGMP